MADLQERLRQRISIAPDLKGNGPDILCWQAADALDAAEAEIAHIDDDKAMLALTVRSLGDRITRLTAERDAAWNEAIEAAVKAKPEREKDVDSYGRGFNDGVSEKTKAIRQLRRELRR